MKISFFIIIIFFMQILLKSFLNELGYMNIFLSQLFCVIIPTIVYFIISDKRIGDFFKFDNKSLTKDIIVALITVISINILSVYLNYPLTKTVQLENNFIQHNISVFEYIISIIILCITPAIFEELFFRGILLNELANKYSYYKASVITALIFSLIHLDILNVFPQFVLGLFLCYITLSSKTILLPIITHLGNNLFSFIVGEYINQYFFQNKSFIFILSLLIAVIGVVYFKRNTLRREI